MYADHFHGLSGKEYNPDKHAIHYRLSIKSSRRIRWRFSFVVIQYMINYMTGDSTKQYLSFTFETSFPIRHSLSRSQFLASMLHRRRRPTRSMHGRATPGRMLQGLYLTGAVISRASQERSAQRGCGGIPTPHPAPGSPLMFLLRELYLIPLLTGIAFV